MAIKGSLKEASLPDVLQLLAMGKKTGCLSVTHRNNFGYIYFEKGRIAYASIVNRRDRLGDLLIKTGLVTREQLEQAVQGLTHELLLARLNRMSLRNRDRSRDDHGCFWFLARRCVHDRPWCSCRARAVDHRPG